MPEKNPYAVVSLSIVTVLAFVAAFVRVPTNTVGDGIVLGLLVGVVFVVSLIHFVYEFGAANYIHATTLRSGKYEVAALLRITSSTVWLVVREHSEAIHTIAVDCEASQWYRIYELPLAAFGGSEILSKGTLFVDGEGRWLSMNSDFPKL